MLSDEILKKYGRNGISLLIDEGFSGISEEYGSTVASLGMAEKGAMNLHIQVETLGGHSSVPPAHTGSTFSWGLADDSRNFGSSPG